MAACFLVLSCHREARRAEAFPVMITLDTTGMTSSLHPSG